ncbi:hypothetical protein BB561_005634 [Smittium simulii]|uniref:L-threonine 3-dehydrogenase, mitochondrial n=1 Tax=Smittium simulii TaxID=133385 RepID=A0A2T9Y9F6_9FUNG|nr:hypothetical protein BB561_005634 [Smittium simulii]
MISILKNSAKSLYSSNSKYLGSFKNNILYSTQKPCFNLQSSTTPFAFQERAYSTDYIFNDSGKKRVLITGGLGQLGYGVASELRKEIGTNNVILSDIKVPDSSVKENGPFVHLDILDPEAIEKIVVNEDIGAIIHFSAVLSALGEQFPQKALDININGTQHVLDISKKHQLRLLIPSSMGAFGPSTVRQNTPDLAIMRPKTVYGIAKVYAELMGEYYNSKHGVDFRSLRYPGIISADSLPGGGTTDYAVDIFHSAVKSNKYNCYLKNDAGLAMMYIDDCVTETVKFFLADNNTLKQRVYNVDAISFTPEELANEIKKQWSEKFEITYAPDFRQNIAITWPEYMNDSKAREDWGYNPKIVSTKDLVSVMFQKINKQKSL